LDSFPEITRRPIKFRKIWNLPKEIVEKWGELLYNEPQSTLPVKEKLP
jgi:hypothetical protein